MRYCFSRVCLFVCLFVAGKQLQLRRETFKICRQLFSYHVVNFFIPGYNPWRYSHEGYPLWNVTTFLKRKFELTGTDTPDRIRPTSEVLASGPNQHHAEVTSGGFFPVGDIRGGNVSKFIAGYIKFWAKSI